MMLEAVAPLGDDYVDGDEQGLRRAAGWTSTRVRASCRARTWRATPTTCTRTCCMNYNDNYESVTTLAHEWGHAMHSYSRNKAQPFVTSNYATFVAEIASTFNEDAAARLRAEEREERRRAALLPGLRARRTCAAPSSARRCSPSSSAKIHDARRQGRAADRRGFTKIYGEILRRYHGDAQGVVKIDDAYCVEWAYIPHFYYNFYVYQYATSIAASALFADGS